MPPSIRLLTLCGPTATGKTRLAAALAREFGLEILSADSRQVYRGLDIGTGKDLELYRSGKRPVPFHLIDVADPAEVYGLYRYQTDCYSLLMNWKKTNPILFVGGSGLYIEAVLRRYSIPSVPENPEFRAEHMALDKEELLKRLQGVSEPIRSRTDTSSKKRMVRALEIDWQNGVNEVVFSNSKDLDFNYQVFCVDCPPQELNEKIKMRLEARLGAGLIEEVEFFLGKLGPLRMFQLGLEYREVSLYLEGKKNKKQMCADLYGAIVKMAKAQRTYFRGLERRGIPVQWINPGEDAYGTIKKKIFSTLDS